MAAQLKDVRHEPSVKLVRSKDFDRLVATCKNPPKPSNALIRMFSANRSADSKD